MATMGTMMPVFRKFQQEAEIIGRLVVGYGEMELDLCNCVAMGIDDLDMAIKAMFRPRGETSRIDVADAIGQKTYASLGLGATFAEAIDSMRFCLRIRNRYAHSHFYDDNTGKLAIVSLEEIAKKKPIIRDLLGLSRRYLDANILRKQDYIFSTRAPKLIF